jgi:hypothetical protein
LIWFQIFLTCGSAIKMSGASGSSSVNESDRAVNDDFRVSPPLQPLNEEVEPATPSGTSASSHAVGSSLSFCNSWLVKAVTSAVEAYSTELRVSPIRTKAITSCAISILGELIGNRLKPARPDGTKGKYQATKHFYFIPIFICIFIFVKLCFRAY